MALKDDLIVQECLKIQLKRIVEHVQENPEFWDILEQKPFFCGNQVIINYPEPLRCLKIEMKISLTDFNY